MSRNVISKHVRAGRAHSAAEKYRRAYKLAGTYRKGLIVVEPTRRVPHRWRVVEIDSEESLSRGVRTNFGTTL